MKSVKHVGHEYYCKVGEFLKSKDGTIDSGKGESIIGGGYLFCSNPLRIIKGYPNSFEFSLNLRKMIFKLYEQSNGHKIFSKGIRIVEGVSVTYFLTKSEVK